MAWGPPTIPITLTTITVAFATALLNSLNWLRQLTGNGDPPAADRVIVSTSTSTSSWQQVTAAVIATGAVTDVKMATQKVNQVNPTYTTFAAATDKGSGFFDIVSNADAPTAGSGWLLIQNRHWNWGSDRRWQLAINTTNQDDIYVRSVIDGVAGPWRKLWHAGNDAGIANLVRTNASSTITGGNLSFGTGLRINFANENGLKIDLSSTLNYTIEVTSSTLKFVTARYVEFWNALAGGFSLRYDTQNHVLNINGDDKVFVPLNAVVWFPTLADLTAAGASWTRHTAADGRLLVGAGTASSPTLTNAQTFAEATNYGTDWGHGHANTLSASSSAIPAGTTGPLVPTAGGTTQVAETSHVHSAPTISVSGGVTSTVWLPGALRAGIWGRRI